MINRRPPFPTKSNANHWIFNLLELIVISGSVNMSDVMFKPSWPAIVERGHLLQPSWTSASSIENSGLTAFASSLRACTAVDFPQTLEGHDRGFWRAKFSWILFIKLMITKVFLTLDGWSMEECVKRLWTETIAERLILIYGFVRICTMHICWPICSVCQSVLKPHFLYCRLMMPISSPTLSSFPDFLSSRQNTKSCPPSRWTTNNWSGPSVTLNAEICTGKKMWRVSLSDGMLLDNINVHLLNPIYPIPFLVSREVLPANVPCPVECRAWRF